jgi:aspartyl-tRNA(Asn)/glutamyl-tRNA(Gln) amidotransferase subunit B
VAAEVVAANPAQVAQYKGGKTTVLAFFVGQAMKATKGRANPAVLNQLILKELSK